MNSDSITTLKAARDALLKLHRELITSEKEVYEKSVGPIATPVDFLNLLAHDPWFDWLRPFSGLVAKIDDAWFDKKNPLSEETAAALLGEIRTLLSGEGDEHGFGRSYRQALKRDPHGLAAHANVLRLLERSAADETSGSPGS